jgi:hypothetical protein
MRRLLRHTAGPVLWMLLAGLLAVWPATVRAHEDVRIPRLTHRIAAGGHVAVPVSLHFHRLAGRIEPAGGPVTLMLLDEAALAEFRAGRAVTPVWSITAAGPSRFNTLIPCCKGTAWAPHALVLAGSGEGERTAYLEAVFVHDDFAVIIYDAEYLAAAGTAGAAAVLSLTALLLLRRGAGRRPAPGTRLASGRARRARELAAVCLLLFAVLLAGLAVCSYLGMSAYGGNPVEGLVGAAPMEWIPEGPFAGKLATVMIAASVLWAAALLLWARAGALAWQEGSRLVAAAGLILGLTALSFGYLFAVTYGSLPVPAVLAVLLGALPLLGSLRLWRRLPPFMAAENAS